MSLPRWPSRRCQGSQASTLRMFREVVGIPWSLCVVAKKERQQKAIESCDNYWCRGPDLRVWTGRAQRSHGQHLSL